MGFKKLLKKYKRMKNNPLKGNIKDRVRKVKDFLAEAQKSDVASKYAGVEAFPGMVKSEQKRREDTAAVDQAAAAQIAATAEDARRNASSMPSKAEQELQARRRAARAKRTGRAATILTDETLG